MSRAPLLIEIVGAPGAGKTSFVKAFTRALNAKGETVRNTHDFASDASQDRRTPRFVKSRPERALLHRFLRFQRNHPDLDAMAGQSLSDAPVRHLLYAIMAAGFQASRDLASPGDVVLIDEGFLNHGVATFFGDDSRGDLDRYLALVPLADMVLFLSTPAEVAYARALERRGGGAEVEAAVHAKFGDLKTFQDRLSAFEHACSVYEGRGVPVIKLDTVAHRPKALAQQAHDGLSRIFSSA